MRSNQVFVGRVISQDHPSVQMGEFVNLVLKQNHHLHQTPLSHGNSPNSVACLTLTGAWLWGSHAGHTPGLAVRSILSLFTFISVALATQSRLTLCDPMACRLPSSSVHGILQARILEWVAISYLRGSSQPRGQVNVS